MKPSEVMLRSETNWTRSSFPFVTIFLCKGGRNGEKKVGEGWEEEICKNAGKCWKSLDVIHVFEKQFLSLIFDQ